jgi:ATP-binding cassette subfamily B protein/subfamily B ATP-binding cassette protein MsbA
MKNFFRVVRLTLRRRYTFAAAVACSIGVALFWGGNLAMLKPVIDIVFSNGKMPHAVMDQRVAEAQAKLAATNMELGRVTAELAVAAPDKQRDLKAQQGRLQQRRTSEVSKLEIAEYVRPLVKSCLPNDTFTVLVIFLGFFIVATLIKDAMLVGNLVLVERLTQLATLDLRNRMFRKTLAMELAHFGEGHSSHTMHRISSDVTCAFNGVNVLCGRMILEPLKMIACLAGAAYICWRLLVVSLLIAPLAAYIMVRLSKSLRKANKRAMEEMGLLYTLLAETLTNIQTVKAFGMERHERRRYHKSGKNFYHRSMRIMFFTALGRGSGEFMGMTIICLAISAGAFLVLHPEARLFGIAIINRPLEYSSLLAFFALLAGVSDPARKMSEVMGTLQRGIAAADRVFEILDCRPKIVDPPVPKVLPNPRPELVFDRVSFQYSTGQRVLHDVELRIPFGQTVAIVGPNGCGKTTLVNLLPRFYDAIEGAVRLDGIDIRDLRVKDLRRLTGFVAQQGTLFDDTVMNNIRYGSPHTSDEEVMAAAEKAFAHRFIVERLGKGYQTVVGERGGRLSGGQRQRVLLARAILRDPKFLILDEATSQIDLESEQLIHRVLEKFIHGRTTLMITHRMSSIALADRIVVMDMGRIIDSGTHDELLGRCDLYTRLYQLGFQQAA